MPAYKQYRRTQRNMAVEENFNFGMRYTETPLSEGYCRALINYDFKDGGVALVPRPGYQTLYSIPMERGDVKYYVHHTGQGIITNTDTNEDFSRRYTLLCYDEPGVDWFDFSKCRIMIENSFNTVFDDEAGKSFTPANIVFVNTGDRIQVRRKVRAKTQQLHDISLFSPDLFNDNHLLPVYSMLNSVAIMPIIYTPNGGSAVNGFGKLKLTTNNTGIIYATIEYIQPQAINPTEAVNYGYNMLTGNPYTFNDSISSAVANNYIIMDGIIPYTTPECAAVKFNARVGEQITFRVFCRFPNNTSTYKFRWEIREVGTDNVSVYENQQSSQRVYKFNTTTSRAVDTLGTTNTDFVHLTLQPPFKQFSVTVTAYSTTDLTEPLQVMTLASYTLAADSSSLTTNVEPKSYPVHSTQNICTWKQRIVLWGVAGADNMLFVSDVNNPAYFPYPHGVEVFEEKVVSCVPYLGDLLVFTESKLHRMSWSADGLSFKTDMIQDKLLMSDFDKETVTVVQNMVFFKNGSYFYMVVPRKSSAEPGALQLAPISTNITNMLDTFKMSAEELFFRLYNPIDTARYPHLASADQRTLAIQDYYSYLDNTVVRNIYKFQLVDVNKESKQVNKTILYFDLMLNYDTMSRAWTTYIVQTNATRLQPYRQNITDTTVYSDVVNVPNYDEYGEFVDYSPTLLFIKPNVHSSEDVFEVHTDTVIPNRVLKNHQYVDTGYRDHDTQVKKRYRELQFKINNTSQETLQFGTEFVIDDEVRKGLFKYETRHVVDEATDIYGYFYVERVFATPLIVGGATVLGENDDVADALYMPTEYTTPSTSIMLESSRWTLDVSQLSDVSVIKVRMRVSGKGYSPRMMLVSFNDTLYEMLNHNWVYRVMNAR